MELKQNVIQLNQKVSKIENFVVVDSRRSEKLFHSHSHLSTNFSVRELYKENRALGKLRL
jgi:hypothetical protein